MITGTGTAAIIDGPALAFDTLRRLLCDARIQWALTDPDHGPVGVGRTTRTVPAWLHRLLRARDHGCRFPGCGRTRFTHAHHLTHWADGGPTDLDNLVTICSYHHRLIHEHGWTITGNPNHHLHWHHPRSTKPFTPRPPYYDPHHFHRYPLFQNPIRPPHRPALNHPMLT